MCFAGIDLSVTASPAIPVSATQFSYLPGCLFDYRLSSPDHLDYTPTAVELKGANRPSAFPEAELIQSAYP